MRNIQKHVMAEGGSYRLAITNIACHLDVLLTDEQKAAVNWHPEQSVSLAVMRILSLLNRPCVSMEALDILAADAQNLGDYDK